MVPFAVVSTFLATEGLIDLSSATLRITLPTVSTEFTLLSPKKLLIAGNIARATVSNGLLLGRDSTSFKRPGRNIETLSNPTSFILSSVWPLLLVYKNMECLSAFYIQIKRHVNVILLNCTGYITIEEQYKKCTGDKEPSVGLFSSATTLAD